MDAAVPGEAATAAVSLASSYPISMQSGSCPSRSASSGSAGRGGSFEYEFIPIQGPQQQHIVSHDHIVREDTGSPSTGDATAPRDLVSGLGIIHGKEGHPIGHLCRKSAVRKKSADETQASAPKTPKSSQRLLDSPKQSSVSSPSRWSPLRASWGLFRQFKGRWSRLGDKNAVHQQDADVELGEDQFDDEAFDHGFGKPPVDCSSRRDITTPRRRYVPNAIILTSIYSTAMSLLWLVVSFVQPGYGGAISSFQRPDQASIAPGTATNITTLLAKSIEMSFGFVFVAFLGQVLSKRCLLPNKGMTLAELDMRNWVTQPSSIVSHFEALRYNVRGFLGWLTFATTISVMFYTTASDAMISPKLRSGKEQQANFSGLVRSSYANVNFVKASCPNLFADATADKGYIQQDDGQACLNVQLSGQAYRDLLSFMSTWSSMRGNGTLGTEDMARRPRGTNLLYNNLTMTSAWVETWNSNVTASYEEHGRIINNVSMAIPHPGVYEAATSPKNLIQQPRELADIGGYSIRASVVSPVVNVMCVNMTAEELAPLIWITWPRSDKNTTKDWQRDIPLSLTEAGDVEYLNRTVVDDLFQWGPAYNRRPPVFATYPPDFNFVSNTSVVFSDSIYLLGKGSSAQHYNYSLCEARSWLSPNCSTHLNISGPGGTTYEAHCDDAFDKDAYYHMFDKDEKWPKPDGDWRWLADEWGITNNMNGGIRGDNAANNRILNQLALTEPRLASNLPSLAEALAVFLGSTLVMGSVQTPFNHTWDHPGISNLKEAQQTFRATFVPQEYTSYHTLAWQSIFYVVLLLAFLINLFCLVYFLCQREVVTDLTKPENLFALAMNSPPSTQLKGSCGGGPEKRDLVVPWRLGYAWAARHYFFLEASQTPWKGWYRRLDRTAAQSVDSLRGSSYKRMTSRSGWLS